MLASVPVIRVGTRAPLPQGWQKMAHKAGPEKLLVTVGSVAIQMPTNCTNLIKERIVCCEARRMSQGAQGQQCSGPREGLD